MFQIYIFLLQRFNIKSSSTTSYWLLWSKLTIITVRPSSEQDHHHSKTLHVCLNTLASTSQVPQLTWSTQEGRGTWLSIDEPHITKIVHARSIFQEMISMDTLIVQIMNQAQKLVSADRLRFHSWWQSTTITQPNNNKVPQWHSQTITKHHNDTAKQ